LFSALPPQFLRIRYLVSSFPRSRSRLLFLSVVLKVRLPLLFLPHPLLCFSDLPPRKSEEISPFDRRAPPPIRAPLLGVPLLLRNSTKLKKLSSHFALCGAAGLPSPFVFRWEALPGTRWSPASYLGLYRCPGRRWMPSD